MLETLFLIFTTFYFNVTFLFVLDFIWNIFICFKTIFKVKLMSCLFQNNLM